MQAYDKYVFFLLFSFNPALVICLVIALLFWLLRLIKVIYNIFKYMEIKAFYTYALKISAVSSLSFLLYLLVHKESMCRSIW